MASEDKKAKRKLAPSKPLSGFQDLLPEQALAFHDAIDKITAVYKRYGYGPIDTPCIFQYETLAGDSGEISKQLYRWTQGKRDVALRFDLTVPLARYVAANEARLTFPFKRYHWGKVWRGERPQKGRYREFTQLDFDIVGTECPTADLEAVLVINDAMVALGLERFTIRLNDREVLNGVLAGLGLTEQAEDVLRIIDKLDKVGEQGVTKELSAELGLTTEVIDGLLDFTRLNLLDCSTAVISQLEQRYGDNEAVARGIERLDFMTVSAAAVLPEGRLIVDPAIARGLGYYTGPVFETVLDDQPEMGSVCSGGRYDDLASAYTKRRLPGVGASVGLSRLLAALEERQQDRPRGTPVIILLFGEVAISEGLRLRAAIHEAGIGAELYPQTPPGFGKPVSPKAQFRYASQKGFRFAIVLGEQEVAAQTVQLKNLDTTEQREIARAQLIETLTAAL